MKKITVGFCGLSHLGLCYMAAYSAKKFNVIGYDVSNLKVDELNKNNFDINEPNLKKIFQNSNISITNDIRLLKSAKLIFISEDVSTNKNNVSDYTKVLNYFTEIKKYYPNKKVIFLSQMKPNFFKNLSINKKKNTFYQVETLVFGEGVKRSISPERIIIAGEGSIPKDILLIYKKFTPNVIKTNFQTAELIKIFINIFLISNLTTANYLSEISDKTGASWQDIETALRMDKRIGKFSYIKPGLGISGGNLERDLINVSDFANINNLKIPIFNIFKQYSKFRKNWPYEIFRQKLNINKKLKIRKVLICGLTYKLNTHSMKNSPSINLINNLKKHNDLIISCYDPNIKYLKNNQIKILDSLKSSKEKFDFIFIMLPLKNIFKKYYFLNKIKKKTIIADPFSVLDRSKIKSNELISLC